MKLSSGLITLSDVKKRYGLTASLIKKLGGPNQKKKNPYIKGGPPLNLYSEDRVRTWIRKNQKLIRESRKRKKAAKKAVQTKYWRGRHRLRSLLKNFVLVPVDLDEARIEAKLYFNDRYNNFDGEVTERGLVAYLRHKYTNYEVILDKIKGSVGAGILYTDTKVYLSVRIIDFYKLKIDPLIAAFGHPKDVPDRYRSSEATGILIRRLLGLKKE